MTTNLESYKSDLAKLISKGEDLHMALHFQCFPEGIEEKLGKKKAAEFRKELPNFDEDYQSWYSESKAVIKQLLPDRLQDFCRHYEKPKSRKSLDSESYRIDDCLQGLSVTQTSFGEKSKIVGPDAAIPHLKQQQAILKAVESRFESSLFDIQQIVQADIFDSELAAAREFLKKGFLRAAGAVAGVVLEKHLGQVAQNHSVTTRKKNPTISDYNDLLKGEGVLDTPNWRQIQRLGDIRNLCDHSKDRDPTKEEVEELIDGVEKFTKTLF